MKKRILLICCCLLFVFLSMPVRALQPDAYTIIANPAEDASIEMNINWHTDLKYTKSYVEYTKKTDTNWTSSRKVYGTYEENNVFDGNYSKKANGDNFYEEAIFLDYSATLTNLEPGTEYMYKVGQDVLSDVHYFKTASDDGNFSFAWISDYHSYTPLPSRLTSAEKMMETIVNHNKGVDFIFSTGDDIAWGGSYSFWQDLYEKESHHKNYMYAGVIGNHDYMDRTDSKNSNQFFKTVNNYPLNGYEGEEGVCYYFIYSNVLFITLNNENMKTSEQVEKAQKWFEEVVQNNPTQYIIVAQHYEWFNGINGASRSAGEVRWRQLFDKYGVDLALGGNNHIYLRTNSLYDGKVSNDPNKGTVYIDAPSSDNERGQSMNDTLSNNQDLIAKRWTEGGNTVGGMAVNVTTENIKVELLDRNSNIIDSVIINSRRDVHPIGNFNKEEFENSFQYYPYSSTAGVLSCSSKGIRFINNIKVSLDNKILVSQSIKKLEHTNIVLEGLKENSLNTLEIFLTYCDNTTSQKSFVINTNINKGSIQSFKAEIKNNQYVLSWENTFNNNIIDKYKIYQNGNFVKEITDNTNNCIIDVNEISLLDEFKIEAYQGDYLVISRTTNYFDSYDANLDGIFSIEDVKELQKVIVHQITFSNEYQLLYDFNNDGILDIADASYLYCYLEKKIQSLNEKKFKVTFIDMYGNIIDIKEVTSGSDVIPPTSEIDGWIFISWNEDYHNICKDKTIQGIYIKDE